jgi:hypothetical protein
VSSVCPSRATDLPQDSPARSLSALGDGLIQRPLAVIGGVQIYQRGPPAGVARAFHHLARAGYGLGRQVIAGVAQIVEVDAVQAGCSERGSPDGAPQVAVPKQLSARRGEQQRIGGRASVVLEMLLNLSDDAASQDDARLLAAVLGGGKNAAWSRASVSWQNGRRSWGEFSVIWPARSSPRVGMLPDLPTF